jgi:hypothetical protein
VLEHVDDLELVLPAQLSFTDTSEVRDGGLSARRSSRDVELEDERCQNSSPGRRGDAPSVVERGELRRNTDLLAWSAWRPQGMLLDNLQ